MSRQARDKPKGTSNKRGDHSRVMTQEADILTSSYRAPALARLGVTEAELFAARPGLILVTNTCFGHVGPMAQYAGFEGIAVTVTGERSTCPPPPHRALMCQFPHHERRDHDLPRYAPDRCEVNPQQREIRRVSVFTQESPHRRWRQAEKGWVRKRVFCDAIYIYK